MIILPATKQLPLNLDGGFLRDAHQMGVVAFSKTDALDATDCTV